MTFASRTGYTAGVAEAIGKTLNESGVQAEILPMREVKDLVPYSAFIIGSAIQGAKWLPEAIRFITSNKRIFEEKPCAMFTVCMTLAMKGGEKYRDGIAEWVKPVRSVLKPLHEEIFAGGLDIRKLPSLSDRLRFRLSVLFGVWREGDHRDWEAIEKWAKELKPLLIEK